MTTPPSAHGRGWPLLAVLGVGVILIGAAILAYANPLGKDGDDDPESSTYTEAIVGVPSRVNPLFAYASSVDRDIASLVFSGLVRLEADGTPVGDLAETWDVSEDGLTVTFRLRPGVKWHTGEAFDAEDVLFTYNLLADPTLQGDPEQAALWQSIDCTAPDKLIVACVLPEPYAPFLSYATMGILPRYILETANAQTILDDPFNKAPVGTGPFELEQMNNSRAVLKANKDYYLGPPQLDEIDLSFYPDMASAAADVIRGQAEGLLVDLTVNPGDYQALRDVDGLDEHVQARSGFTLLYLNNTAPPLNDKAVRGAISRAVDIDSIITSLLGGRGERADTPIVPGTWAFDEDIDPPDKDLGTARSMLEDDGWVLEDDATVRTKNNTELRISLLTDQDALRGAIAEAVAAQLTDIGIDVTVVRQPSSDLVRDFLLPRQYQAAIFGWDPGADPDPYPAWHSSQAINNGRNIAGYTSDQADEILEEARRTSNIADRRELYVQFQELFLDDVASIPLYVPLFTYFVSSAVQNIEPGVLFTPSSRFRNVNEWTMDIGDPVLGGQ